MSLRRFFSEQRYGERGFLVTEDELHHLRTVNRARPGDEIEIFDGQGGLFLCRIVRLTATEGRVEILESLHVQQPPVRLIMAPSLTKRRNMNFLMEKLTELGVDVIQPLICSRTDEKYHPVMLGRWRRLAVQSMKVSRRLWPTVIEPPEAPSRVAERFFRENSASGVMLHIEGKGGLLDSDRLAEPVLCAAGPPGDFTPEERQCFLSAGFKEFRINDGNLKTETATIAAAAILKNRFTGLTA